MNRASKRWLGSQLIFEPSELFITALAVLLVGILVGWAIGGTVVVHPNHDSMRCLEAVEVNDVS